MTPLQYRRLAITDNNSFLFVLKAQNFAHTNASLIQTIIEPVGLMLTKRTLNYNYLYQSNNNIIATVFNFPIH